MKGILRLTTVPALLLTALVAFPATQGGPATGAKVFTGARLFDGTGKPAIENAVIVVRGGKIVAAGSATSVTSPPDAERISLAGKTVIPGLINAHGHVNTADRDLPTYAAYGVTTVVSLGGENAATFAARDTQRVATLDRARVYVAGVILTPSTPDEARRMVADHEASKADIVKIRVDDNLGTSRKMAPEIYRAIIDEAHKRGRRVAAHLFYLDDAKSLLDAGADLVAHSIRDTDVDASTIATLKARNVCLVPTLMRDVSTFVYESTPSFFADPLFLRYSDAEQIATLKEPARQLALKNNAATPRNKAALEVANRNLKKLSDAGVTIAMGTDTGPAGRFQGYFELMELDLMVKAGLTPTQAVLAATRDAARCLKIDAEVGTLEPQRWADFVVLDGNPLADIANTRKIADVFIAGNRVKR